MFSWQFQVHMKNVSSSTWRCKLIKIVTVFPVCFDNDTVLRVILLFAAKIINNIKMRKVDRSDKKSKQSSEFFFPPMTPES